jgi:tRNA-dihydrouridine synthase A
MPGVSAPPAAPHGARVAMLRHAALRRARLAAFAAAPRRAASASQRRAATASALPPPSPSPPLLWASDTQPPHAPHYTAHPPPPPEPRFSVAPMMDFTCVHFRHLCRLMTRRAVLYTEMVVDSTVNNCSQVRNLAVVAGIALRVAPVFDALCPVLQEKLVRYLDFPTAQHPLALQLGGSDAASLGAAASVARRFGYAELNLNCGCPSPKVAGSGCFGAALMSTPEAVGDACAAMGDSFGAPATVKCRTGVDDAVSYDLLARFVDTVARRGGVKHFVVHARIALLDGLSPEQNRNVPPLRYEMVLALARDFPELTFTLNGGLKSLPAAAAAVRTNGGALRGAMLGRAVWERPWDVLSDVDRTLYGDARGNPATSRRQVVADYVRYADEAQASGRFGRDAAGGAYPTTRALVRPLLNLFAGVPRGGRWRSALDTLLQEEGRTRGKRRPGAVADVIERSLHVLPPEALDAPPPDWRAEALEAEIAYAELPPPARAPLAAAA